MTTITRLMLCALALGVASMATFVPTSHAAGEIHVPADFSMIQAAIDAAQAGDTVIVAPGTYVESLAIANKSITLRSASGADVTRIASPAARDTVIEIDVASPTVSGFTISGGRASFGGGMDLRLSDATITDNIFEGNEGFGAGIWGNGSSPVIERNVFRSNTCDTQHLSGVVTFVNRSSPLIRNNIFADNACRALNLTLPEGNAPVVANNTIARNRVGIHVDVRVPSGAQVYRNNIIVQNEVGLELVFGAEIHGPTWEHNLVYANGTNYAGATDRTGAAGNISGDPRFTQTTPRDFRLAASSPAIDSGTLPRAPVDDFAGNPRPFDGDGGGTAEVDMGAFEYTICGDVNDDGIVDQSDFVMVQRQRRYGEPFGPSDVNLDGRVDKLDARIVKDQRGVRC